MNSTNLAVLQSDILDTYYADNARKLHKVVDRILCKSGGLSSKDTDDFYSVERAINQRNKTPGKCAGYYYIDTEKNKSKIKRKNYSDDERKIIYNKSSGRCELCGMRLSFMDITLDHIIPLSMGGKDNLDNLQAACFSCNQFKSNILPDDFMDRIIRIFLYQTEKKCSRI